MSEAHQTDRWPGEGPSFAGPIVKKEKVEEEDFTFDNPCQKKMKTSGACQGQPTALPSSEAQTLSNELNMNWDLIEVLWDMLVFFMCGKSSCCYALCRNAWAV